VSIQNLKIFHVASDIMAANCLTKALSRLELSKKIKKILKV